ncbi:conserved hypothetical protein [Tenacibaculum maritimum]|nr:conserved hypothetical protein [Tenacibaculum maritimum]
MYRLFWLFLVKILDMVTIEIPVSQYIKKYLISVYGTNYKLSLKDDFGILVLNCLQKKTYYQYKNEKEDRITSFPVKISISQFDKYGCLITEKQLYEIYKTLDYQFRGAIYRAAIVNNIRFKIDYKDSIWAHLESYDITDEDISWETIRKDFNRKKLRIKEQLFLVA